MMNGRPRPNFHDEMHILPEPVELNYKDNHFADLQDFTPECPTGFSRAMALLLDQFTFRASSGKPFRILPMEAPEDDEAYAIDATEERITVSVASERAALYAVQTLMQMRRGNTVPTAQVKDQPAMKIRGMQINLSSIRQFRRDDVLALIRKLGKFKLNTLGIEYQRFFPFAKHPALREQNGCFSREDIAAFDAACAENGVDVIPLLQCLGHNGFISRRSEYSHLFEPVSHTDSAPSVQYCPLNPDCFELYKDLASELMEAHPGGKYFHIGGDEARNLGMCPKCAEFAAKYGCGRLYADHVNKVAEWVISKGRTPIIWDDMLSHYLDVIPMMRRDLVIMYWDYWTTSDPSPITVLRPAGEGIVIDRSRVEDGYAGMNEPELLIAKTFAAARDLEEIFRQRPEIAPFRKYLGADFPRSFTAFPFLDLYRKLGFKVIGAPTTLGNTVDDIYGLPNFMRFRKNIYAFAKKCKEHSVMGMMTSAWYDFPPEILEMGLICTANDLWSTGR